MDYIEGARRGKRTLFPKSLEDAIEEDNPVRVIDFFVESLDLKEKNFSRTEINKKGRKPYSPKVLLKLYIYGYFNKIRSSRQLEKECKRNIEVMWLINKLIPSHQVIAYFRKENNEEISSVLEDLNKMLYAKNLLKGKAATVDGSRFKADTSKKKVYSKKSIKNKLKQTRKKINKYLKILEDNEDKNDEDICIGKDKKLMKKEAKDVINYLNEKKAKLEKIENEIENSDQKQYSEIDKDCRLMKKYGNTIAGYNVQIVVDNENHFIIKNKVTNEGSDKNLLYKMGKSAKIFLGVNTFILLADKGYYNTKDLNKCYQTEKEKEENGIDEIKAYVPKEGSKRKKYSKNNFKYDKKTDTYECPAGNKLEKYSEFTNRNGLKMKKYRCEECDNCKLRKKCTTAKNGRTVTRWIREDLLEKIEYELAKNPELMRIRGSTVEHVFGTIKWSFGYYYFLLRGIDGAQVEFDLMSIAYNLKRAINMVGVKGIIKLMKEFYFFILKIIKKLEIYGNSTNFLINY